MQFKIWSYLEIFAGSLPRVIIFVFVATHEKCEIKNTSIIIFYPYSILIPYSAEFSLFSTVSNHKNCSTHVLTADASCVDNTVTIA